MAWYYAQGSERQGPFNDDDFRNLVAQGVITDTTLVWRDGMENWQPYAVVRFESASPGVSEGAQGTAGYAPMTVCSSCGRSVPSDEVIEYQGAYICASCKPVFLQQLKEGVRINPAMDFGGFWIRVAATLIDAIILFVPNFLFGMLTGFVMSSMQNSDSGPLAAIFVILVYLVQFAIPITYETWFIGRFGQTPGKMVCGLKVVRSDGSSLTYMRAFGRYWAKVLSYMICYIGVIMVAFDEEKRGLHDHICDTRVVRV